MTQKKEKPGPKAETLKIEGKWEDALKKAMTRNDPPRKGTRKKRRS